MSSNKASEREDGPGASRSRLGGFRNALLSVVATAWLLASIAAGIWLMIGGNTDDSVRLDVDAPELSSSSSRISYGGDAYTGIQNAAADTEGAVVEGVNELADLQIDLQEEVSERAGQEWELLRQGLGVIVIGLGILNFTVALRRTS